MFPFLEPREGAFIGLNTPFAFGSPRKRSRFLPHELVLIGAVAEFRSEFRLQAELQTLSGFKLSQYPWPRFAQPDCSSRTKLIALLRYWDLRTRKTVGVLRANFAHGTNKLFTSAPDRVLEQGLRMA